MGTPWLDIPLGDYEGHMALPSIGQAKMLADHFERVITRYAPASVAVIGCAGGNGLERIDPDRIGRVVAVDVNPEYIKQTGSRHSHRLKGLELHCADVQSDSLEFEPVELMYAALLFEYVDVALALRSLKRNCRSGTILVTVLQLKNQGQETVSPSPFKSLGALAPAISLLAPEDLRRSAVAQGFIPTESELIESPSGKQFCVQVLGA
jgi:hypothetical protein